MLSITKLQNLKAIHNTSFLFLSARPDVINHKTTKFESNSQQRRRIWVFTLWCYQSQNYKIWKQFTTQTSLVLNLPKMLSITKLQNSKAIHNTIISIGKTLYDVINHKTTKFESNSQLIFFFQHYSTRCYQSQNYKIWKQFTTPNGNL